MTDKTKSRDASTMTADELREAGVPYLVDPDDLRMLGLDPEPYLGTMRFGVAGYMLDRTKHRDIIYRLSTMRDRPMSGARH